MEVGARYIKILRNGGQTLVQSKKNSAVGVKDIHHLCLYITDKYKSKKSLSSKNFPIPIQIKSDFFKRK